MREHQANCAGICANGRQRDAHNFLVSDLRCQYLNVELAPFCEKLLAHDRHVFTPSTAAGECALPITSVSAQVSLPDELTTYSRRFAKMRT